MWRVYVALHLLTCPTHNIDTPGRCKMQCIQQFVGRGIHNGDMHHVIVCIQQYSLITLAKCRQLCGIHLFSLVGIKAKNVFTSLLQRAVILDSAVAIPARYTVGVVPTGRHGDA